MFMQETDASDHTAVHRRPLLHAILHSSVRATYGIEVDAVKCQKACPFVSHCIGDLATHGINIPASSLPKFICSPIEQVGNILWHFKPSSNLNNPLVEPFGPPCLGKIISDPSILSC
jgi:hypothetical protein